MAHTVAKTIILDSQREGVIHYTLISDGTSGELNKLVIMDPTTDFNIIPQGNQSLPGITNGMTYRNSMSFSVLEMWFNLQMFSAQLQYDNGVNPQNIWLLSPNSGDAHYDFTSFTGIKDRTGLDGTGRIVITTQGFATQTPLGDQPLFTPTLNLVLRVKKFWKPQYVTNQPFDRVQNQPNPTQAPILPTNPQGNIQP